MKKIVHLTSVHKRHDIRIFVKECVTLSQIFDVELWVFDGRGDECISESLKIKDYGLFTGNRVRSIISVLKHTINISGTLDKSDTVFHFHDVENLFLAYLLAKKGYKVIWDSHEDFPRQLKTKHWMPNFLKGVMEYFSEKIENYIVSRLVGVVTPTQLIENRFRLINTNVACVKNYPVLSEFLGIPLKERATKNICYIGTINKERGIIELMDVLSILGPEFTLVLCGNYDTESLRVEVEKHEAFSQVDFRGYLDRAGVAQALCDSDIGLVTFHPSPNQIESLPIKLFEYMAAGLPVVASDFPLWRQILENSNSGLLVNPFSTKDIASAILAIVDDPITFNNYAKAGRKAAVEYYNWSAESGKLLNFYSSLLGAIDCDS